MAIIVAIAISLTTLLRMISRESLSHVAMPIKKDMPGKSSTMIAMVVHATDMDMDTTTQG
jgi:hypothetical protein